MTTGNAQELGKALNRNENEIIVEGDLANKVVKIKATGNVAWLVAGGAIAVAVIAVLTTPAATATTGPMGLIAESAVLGTAAVGAVGVLGVSTTVAAVSIGVGATSKFVLNKLRKNYSITKINDSKIILRRK